MALRKFGLDGMVVAVTGAGQESVAASPPMPRPRARPWSDCSRTEARSPRLGREVSAAGGVCHTTAIDLATTAGAGEFIDYTVQTCGRIDALVNNAGPIFSRTPRLHGGGSRRDPDPQPAFRVLALRSRCGAD